MRTPQVHSKAFVCEACDESVANPAMMGIESDRHLSLSIRLCQSCGPIDLDLMQLCREITVDCNKN
jgi:hypothetical protein